MRTCEAEAEAGEGRCGAVGAIGSDGGRGFARVRNGAEGWRGLSPLEQLELSAQASCAAGRVRRVVCR